MLRALIALALLAAPALTAAQPARPPTPPAAPLTPAPARPAPPTTLPGVDTRDLDALEITALATLMSEGACPCDTNKSLLDCIRATSCPAATELAGFGAGKLRDGLGIEQVREAVVRKYLEDHMRYTFDLTGTAYKGTLGAPVTIVEFADFECPHCALMRTILTEVVEAFPGKVVLHFKQFPLGHHAHSHGAARAALAAGRQGRFWPMHDLLFQNQGTLSPERFVEFATEIGLNIDRFKRDIEDPALYAQIERDRNEAIAANIGGTPTIYIDGRLYIDDKTPEKLKDHIRQRLAAGPDKKK